MRIVMMGTGPFAVPTFRSLLASSHTVLALVTRPSVAGTTRGKATVLPNPMRDAAASAGIEVLSPPDVNDAAARQQIADLKPDLLVVCDYGQILSADCLSVARLGGINLHGSLLPKYRGAAPVNWAIWKGETETGITVLHMTPRLDAGPSLVQVRTEIGSDETAEQLEPRLATLGVDAVHQAIRLLESWDGQSPIGMSQDPSRKSHARRLKKTDGEVNWSQSANEIYRQFRALQPWPGLYTHWRQPNQGEVRLILESIVPEPTNLANGTPGCVVATEGGRLVIATGDQAIQILRIQPAGKRSMDAGEFLRGCRIQVGEILSRKESN